MISERIKRILEICDFDIEKWIDDGISEGVYATYEDTVTDLETIFGV